jgi:hypothetical protein
VPAVGAVGAVALVTLVALAGGAVAAVALAMPSPVDVAGTGAGTCCFSTFVSIRFCKRPSWKKTQHATASHSFGLGQMHASGTGANSSAFSCAAILRHSKCATAASRHTPLGHCGAWHGPKPLTSSGQISSGGSNSRPQKWRPLSSKRSHIVAQNEARFGPLYPKWPPICGRNGSHFLSLDLDPSRSRRHGSLGITGASVAAATTEAEVSAATAFRNKCCNCKQATKCIVVHNSSLDTKQRSSRARYKTTCSKRTLKFS